MSPWTVKYTYENGIILLIRKCNTFTLRIIKFLVMLGLAGLFYPVTIEMYYIWDKIYCPRIYLL